MSVHRLRRLAAAVALAGVLYAGPAFAQGKKYAFLVGVEKYIPTALTRLSYAEDDVEELDGVLKGLGFETILMTTAAEDPRLQPRTPKHILDLLDKRLKGLEPADTIVAVFSGHGIKLKGDRAAADGSKESYFCPSEADPDSRATLLPVSEITQRIAGSPARRKLLVFDACRNEHVPKAAKSGTAIELEPVKERRTIPQGLLALFSCAEDERSFEHAEAGHGVFTAFMLKYLKGDAPQDRYPNAQISVSELAAYVRRETRDFVLSKLNTDQHPELISKGTDWNLGTLKPGSLVPVKPVRRAGDFDVSFDGDGRATTVFGTGGTQDAYAVAVQRDGKIVTAGQAERADRKGSYHMAVARHNPDGTLDRTFAGDGTLAFSFGKYDDGMTSRALAIQPDGKIVVGGRAEMTGYYYDFGVARLNPDGSFDTTFGNGGASTVNATDKQPCGFHALALQRDGKIVAAGNARLSAAGSVLFGVVRFTADGKLDTTFSGDGKATADLPGDREEVTHVAVHPDGKIVIIGIVDGAGGTDAAILRFNANGTLDSTFDGDGILTLDFGKSHDGGNYVVPQGTKLLVALNTSTATQSRSVLLRLNADGSLDKSFGSAGTGTVVSRLQVNGPVILADGRLLVGDARTDGIEIYSKDGVRDPRFGDFAGPPRTSASRDVFRAIALAPDGSVVMAGNAPAGDGATHWLVARLIKP